MLYFYSYKIVLGYLTQLRERERERKKERKREIYIYMSVM